MTEIRRVGVVSSLAAPVLLIGGWTLAAHLQNGPFDSLSDTISDLAAVHADQRWVMTSALVGVGIAHLTTAVALRPARPGPRFLIMTGGVATMLVAAFPLPADGHSTGHVISAGVAFVSLAVWPAISWQRRSGTDVTASASPIPGSPAAVPDVPWPFRPRVAAGATVVLLGGLAWFFAELFSDGDRVGLSERVAAGSQALWPLAAVLTARASATRTRERLAATAR